MTNVHATNEDREETKEIIRILRDEYDQYESEADSRNREKILGKLNEIVTEWIKEVSEKTGKSKEFIE
jgi:poly(A) polymerase Pap1